MSAALCGSSCGQRMTVKHQRCSDHEKFDLPLVPVPLGISLKVCLYTVLVLLFVSCKNAAGTRRSNDGVIL